jgi:hypothetical protein
MKAIIFHVDESRYESFKRAAAEARDFARHPGLHPLLVS